MSSTEGAAASAVISGSLNAVRSISSSCFSSNRPAEKVFKAAICCCCSASRGPCAYKVGGCGGGASCRSPVGDVEEGEGALGDEDFEGFRADSDIAADLGFTYQERNADDTPKRGMTAPAFS